MPSHLLRKPESLNGNLNRGGIITLLEKLMKSQNRVKCSFHDWQALPVRIREERASSLCPDCSDLCQGAIVPCLPCIGPAGWRQRSVHSLSHPPEPAEVPAPPKSCHCVLSVQPDPDSEELSWACTARWVCNAPMYVKSPPHSSQENE